MRDLMSRPFSSSSSFQDSLFDRIRENFHQLLAPAHVFPSSANGAPLHLLRAEKSSRAGRAQSASLLTHAAILTAFVVLATNPVIRHPNPPPKAPEIQSFLPLPSHLLDRLRGSNPKGGTNSGQGHDQLPPNQGNLPTRSSIQFLKPTIPDNRPYDLAIPPTILDASAPRVLIPVDNMGLPWMADRNNSSGRGKGTTIGEGPDDDSVGNIPGKGVGVGGPPGPYQAWVTHPACAYCPDPQYTDEAREAKLQGRVTLRVLVGADGRATQVQIIQGIGMGLDEQALQSVKGWKFVPARDAAHRAVPTWVTIEVVFRLI